MKVEIELKRTKEKMKRQFVIFIKHLKNDKLVTMKSIENGKVTFYTDHTEEQMQKIIDKSLYKR